QIAVLKAYCENKTFHEVNFQELLDAVKQVEGGSGRERLSALIREQSVIEGVLNSDALTSGDRDALKVIVAQRDAVLAGAGSTLLHDHLLTAQRVLEDRSWPNKNLCPTCEIETEASVLDRVNEGLAKYQVVQELGSKIADAWGELGCGCLFDLEEH